MKCPYCGSEIKDDVKFCGSCGNEMNIADSKKHKENVEKKERIPWFFKMWFISLVCYIGCFFGCIGPLVAFVLLIIRSVKYPNSRKTAAVSIAIQWGILFCLGVWAASTGNGVSDRGKNVTEEVQLVVEEGNTETDDNVMVQEDLTEEMEYDAENNSVDVNQNTESTNGEDLATIAAKRDIYGTILDECILMAFPELIERGEYPINIENLAAESKEQGHDTWIYFRNTFNNMLYTDTVDSFTYDYSSTNTFIKIRICKSDFGIGGWDMTYLPSGELMRVEMNEDDTFKFCGVTYKDRREDVEEKIADYFSEEKNEYSSSVSEWKSKTGDFSLNLHYDDYGRLTSLSYFYNGEFLNSEMYDENNNYVEVDVLDYLNSWSKLADTYGKSLPLAIAGENAYSLGGESKMQYMFDESTGKEMGRIYLCLGEGYQHIFTIDGISVGMQYDEIEDILERDFIEYNDCYLLRSNSDYALKLWFFQNGKLSALMLENIDADWYFEW